MLDSSRLFADSLGIPPEPLEAGTKAGLANTKISGS
jgi:hypothetical protein